MLTKISNFLSQYGDPEHFHEMAMSILDTGLFKQKIPKQEVEGAHNLKWYNPIGLAAGFDKNGAHLNALADLGFGAIEVGTITPKAQAGNLKPRIQKINRQKSILNWMGFPNIGMHEVYKNLKKYNRQTPLGINIGKNADTPSEKAIDDYLKVALKLNPFASYMTVNVSSPNTKGLRSLQNIGFLNELLTEFKNNDISKVFIKISPDLSDQDLQSISSLKNHLNLAGFIATNTTNQHPLGKGGISGRLLKDHSYNTISKLKIYLGDAPLDIIASGGIENKDDLNRYNQIGVYHFQIYSSFVYQGPKILKRLL